MSFQIVVDPFDVAYSRFVSHVRDAIQQTFSDASAEGLTQREMADTLGVDEALISRRLNGPGNVTLRTLSDLFTSMGREPLTHFRVPECPQPPLALSLNISSPASNEATQKLQGPRSFGEDDLSALRFCIAE